MRYLNALITAGMVSITLFLGGCAENPDELAIKDGIISMAKAVEQHDTDTFMQHIAPAYRDRRGRDNNALRQLLDYYFSTNPEINVIISNMEIEIADARDTAAVRVRVLATGGEGKLPERGRLNEITSEWHKQNDAWRVVQARWRPVLLPLN